MSAAKDRKRILFIEDNALDVRLVVEWLREARNTEYEVTEANRLADGLALIADQSFDAILVDLGLPDATGMTVIEKVRAAAPSSAIVVLSGNDDEEAAFETVRLGIQDFLVKGHADGYHLRRSLHYAMERKRLEERIQHLAHHDPLTDLPNRALFQDRLQVASAQCLRRDATVGVFYLDLDGFKAVNDSFGHDAGDQLLKVVAGRLNECIRDGDTLARLGGDEFAIIAEVQSDDPIQHAQAIGRRILDSLAPPVPLIRGGETVHGHVGASIGAVLFPKDGVDIDECLRLADISMYAAKRAGKNRLVIHGFDR